MLGNHLYRTTHIRGINNYEITSIPLVTTGRVALTTSSEVILIMHQHAYHGKNNTIHSSTQIEHCKNKVDDRLHTSIRNALPYTPLRPCTDREWGKLPHIILASDKD